MSRRPPGDGLPDHIGRIAVPQDDVSAATWRWAQQHLPAYLVAHSARAYSWGAAIAAGEGWTFDPRRWPRIRMDPSEVPRVPAQFLCALDGQQKQITRDIR